MNNIAIIPARGGSKRIPKKNIKEFLGKPIIAYSIETALKSELFDEVMVSTDDEEISEIAKKFGATVPFFRRKSTADDFATLNDVFIEVKQQYQNFGRLFDVIGLILPTAPLLNADLLKMGYDFLNSSTFDSVRPVVKFDYPIQRAVKLVNGKVSFFYPEFYRTRSQDLEPAYHDVGMFYFIRGNCELSGDNKGAFEINVKFAQDIDDEDDWKMAEMKYKTLYKN